MNPHRCLCLFFTFALCCRIVAASDWPQWRGPDRTGVSQEKGLMKAWPKEGPKRVWTFKNAGLGFSSFAIADGKLYTLGTRGNDEIILALDAKEGKELWIAKIGPIFTFRGNTWGDGPRSTPTVDGNLLYALGAQGDLVCVDLTKQGKEVWRKNLIADFGGVMMTTWGYSESPLIDGNLLICTPGGEGGTLVALDKKTGTVVWRSKEWTQKAPYSSSIAANIHGVRQYIQTGYSGGSTGGSVAGVDAKTGKVLWTEKISKGESYAICPTPIVKSNQVYVTSGYGAGCHLFDIDSQQKATEKFSKKAQKNVKNTHGGVVLIDGYIYGHSESKGWLCQDFNSGEVLWSERNVLGRASGSITAAEGLLYLYSDEGEVGLVEANSQEFKLISSFTIPEKSDVPNKRPTSRASKTWAHPVIANGHLFLRDHEFIFSYDIRK